MAADDIVSLDARAVQASVTVAPSAGPADLARPTPCGDWALGQLLAHMALQHDGFAAAAAGLALPIAEAVPDDQARLRPGAAFAPRVSAPEGAGPLDQIVALLGRRPGWRPPP